MLESVTSYVLNNIGQGDNNKIDFIANNQDDTVFIQVCLLLKNEETYKKEITHLKLLNNNYLKIILTMDEAPIKDDNGIKIIYAFDWLLK